MSLEFAVSLLISIFSANITCYRIKTGDEMIQSAQIVAIGDEVLWGETINTNAAWMAQFLMSFGIRPSYQCVVPDQESAIGAALGQSLRTADLVVLIGGLGPTADDRTVDAVSEILKRPCRVDAHLLKHLSGRHSHTPGWQASVARQARVVDGATVWLNSRGQAPGQLIPWQDRFVVLLPGPPRELQGIAEQWMAPWLAVLAPGTIHRDTYSVFDLGESAVAAHLSPLLEGEHPRAGIYAQPGRVDIRIETPNSPEGQILRERGRAWVLSRVPSPVYELGSTTREAYLIKSLADRGMTLACMESLTGGMILSKLTGVPGASAAILGGLVAYTDRVKAENGVPEDILRSAGVVSEATVRAMARAVRDRFGASVGVASTGFAGPDGGTEENPTGTFYVAAAGSEEIVVRRRFVPLERLAVRQIAAETAISAVWELLKLPTLLRNLENY